MNQATSLNGQCAAGTSGRHTHKRPNTEASCTVLRNVPAHHIQRGPFAAPRMPVRSRVTCHVNCPPQEKSSGGTFTFAINHLKSKGSACTDVGDPDKGDGQGNCSGTRTQAALALIDFLKNVTNNDPNAAILTMGDLRPC